MPYPLDTLPSGYSTPEYPTPPPDTLPPIPPPEGTWDQRYLTPKEHGTRNNPPLPRNMGPEIYRIPTPPHVNRLIDACENITFPQLLLQPVNISMYVARKNGIFCRKTFQETKIFMIW